MVFYRTYRPQKIEDLDSQKIRESLFNLFSSFNPNDQKDSIPHAFLFTGPKGLGKTSTARIIAKTINCEEKKSWKTTKKRTDSEIEPCDKCSQCKSITNGTNIDILEIDGASNRGIDEIRDLREKVKLAPSSASKKVYIIDEVHMLTTEAFNALLKTLEEPPQHAVFILCTTEPQKVPDTITSRCFHISFAMATVDELVRSFERIIKGEKIKIDKEALIAIAELSDGSFRDGSKILQEIALLSNGEKISRELVEKKYKTNAVKAQLDKTLNALAKKDLKEGLVLINDLYQSGIDLRYFLEQLITRVHKILLLKVGLELENEKLATDLFSIEELKKLIDLLARASWNAKNSPIPQLPLELLFLEWSLEEKEEAVVEETVSVINTPSSRFDQLIEQVKFKNHSVAGVLRGCRLITSDENVVVIEAGFKFHKEKLEELNTKKLLEEVWNKISGKNSKVKIVLKK